MNPLNLVCSDTTRFIIPMLFPNSNYDEVLKDIVDSYSFDYYEPCYDNTIIIVKNNDKLPHTNYNPLYTYKRQNQYCFVYNIPEEFKKDYSFIMKSQYNKLSKLYYTLLLKFWDVDEIFDIKYNLVREVYKVAS